MTLKQYLKQKDPVRMPDVILTKKELIIASTHTNIRKETRSRVYIDTLNSLVAGLEYCLIGTHLYAVDSSGNPKGMSCFRIQVK